MGRADKPPILVRDRNKFDASRNDTKAVSRVGRRSGPFVRGWVAFSNIRSITFTQDGIDTAPKNNVRKAQIMLDEC